MGVNTNTYLYPGVELADLVQAIQRLTDADSVTLRNGYGEGTGIMRLERGGHVQGQDWWELNIEREDGWDDGWQGHSGGVFISDRYERDIPRGGYYVHGGNASAFWAQLGEALVDLFGGAVDLNDCDNSDIDWSKGRTAFTRPHDDTPEYERCEAKLAALENVCADLSRWDHFEGLYDRHGDYVERGKVYPHQA